MRRVVVVVVVGRRNAESIEPVERLAGERVVGVGERLVAAEADDRVERAAERLFGAEAVGRRHQVPVRVQQSHQICTAVNTAQLTVMGHVGHG